jgi:hypothetical protein
MKFQHTIIPIYILNVQWDNYGIQKQVIKLM